MRDLFEPGRRPAAALFDCDGLLVDSEPLWGTAMELVLRSFGRETDTAALTHELTGASIARTVERLHELVDVPGLTQREVEGRLLDRYAEAVAREGVRPMPGAVELVQALAEELPVGVVSNSPETAVRAVLRATGLADRVSAVVGAHGSCRPKPDPEPYLTACALLGVEASACVAFEDSVTGAQAAVSAGLRLLVVPAPGVPAAAYPAGAKLLGSLTEALPARAAAGGRS
ncbi:HAD family phosphatase [Streptomyces sp. NK08204]|uniref:HAD family hydrolase n=1 Tax=Streptomyces sp. NK08204 TaxID=2873260 RepID=UPI001CEDAA70|nr:HAD family phosphatase [Streptomyces sp. NK08204]